jgi:hypothetical protein
MIHLQNQVEQSWYNNTVLFDRNYFLISIHNEIIPNYPTHNAETQNYMFVFIVTPPLSFPATTE